MDRLKPKNPGFFELDTRYRLKIQVQQALVNYVFYSARSFEMFREINKKVSFENFKDVTQTIDIEMGHENGIS